MINMEDEQKTNSNRELIQPGGKEEDTMSASYGYGGAQFANVIKSVPTDKYYLELEKRFAIQNKNVFARREQERLRMISEAEASERLREQLKFQISTTRTALYTHKILRAFFLLVQGLNVGFQVWHAIIIYLIQLSNFSLKSSDSALTNMFEFFILFQGITMPVHCISYFLLVVCLVDTMDRLV